MPVRKTSNRVGQGLMLYTLVMYGGVFAVTFVKTFAGIFFMHMGYDVDVWGSDPENDAVGLIGGVLLGLYMLFLFGRRDVSKAAVFGWRKDLPLNRLLGIMCVLMCGQLVFALGAEGIERLLNLIGLSAEASVETATADSTTLSMFIYTGVVAPVVEELVYRGYVMQSFTRFGKGFAVVFSALLFGVMHANLPQGLYAFYCGLVLGYVAMRYSIVWSIILHAINNLIFGDLFLLITDSLEDDVYNMVSGAMNLVFVAGAALAAIVWGRDLLERAKASRTEKGTWRHSLTAVFIIIFVLLHLAIAVASLERL